MARRPVLSIIIKTLNEEAKIARAIESALAAAKGFPSSIEIVVADSLSTDRTVEIAARYPVRVVQFTRVEDRGCGAGVQLGYQHSCGEYIYLLDGDMELVPGFLAEAYRVMQSDSRLAGVAGLLEDTRVNNAFDRIRVANRAAARPGELDWLDGGGLYRRTAIDAVGGYAANRNLKAYEEAELGLRLRAAGWKLLRLPLPGVRHTGHDAGTLVLLARHWRSRRAMAAGVLLREAIGQPWWRGALRKLIHPLAAGAWWCMLALAVLLLPEEARVLTVATLIAVMGSVVLLLALKKRDLAHVTTSLFHWHYGAAAIAIGFCYRQRPPLEPIPCRVLHEPVRTEIDSA